jgi:hypothetical protein
MKIELNRFVDKSSVRHMRVKVIDVFCFFNMEVNRKIELSFSWERL